MLWRQRKSTSKQVNKGDLVILIWLPKIFKKKFNIPYDIKHSKWPILFPSRQKFQKGPVIFNWVCSCKHIIKFVL